jgi:hypothetical protein
VKDLISPTASHPDVLPSIVGGPADYLQRICNLESLVYDIHCAIVGSSRASHGMRHDDVAPYVPSSGMGKSFSNKLTTESLNPLANEFVPVTPPASSLSCLGDHGTSKIARLNSCGSRDAAPPVITKHVASAQSSSQWEALDPWLFLDKQEYACIRASCKRSRGLVDRSTPFRLFTPCSTDEKKGLDTSPDAEIAASLSPLPCVSMAGSSSVARQPDNVLPLVPDKKSAIVAANADSFCLFEKLLPIPEDGTNGATSSCLIPCDALAEPTMAQ